MFTCIQECSRVARVPIIADGGVRCNGDIAKALVAGASLVMCGSIFASCSDSPAPVVRDESGRKYKQYYGSASIHNKKNNKNVEGTMRLMETDNFTYIEKMNEVQEDLQSAISYAGGKGISALLNVRYGVRI
jgi:GMP reductase